MDNKKQMIDQLNQLSENLLFSAEEYKSFVDVLISAKDSCVFADDRYQVLSNALDWAIRKHKETFLQQLGIDSDDV